MPTSTERHSPDVAFPQPDRNGSPRGRAQEEPRDFETQVSDDDRRYNAPFDNRLEPIEDSGDVNTHGSER